MANAVSAASFLGTLGVNTHLDFDAYGYQNLANVESDINYLGVQIIRDSAEVASDAQTWLQVAQATGAKFDDYIAETSPAGMQTDLGYVQQLAQEGILASIEGGNEEDDAYPASLGNTLTITAQFQQQVYALGQQLGLPVINMSFGAGWTAANNWQGDYGAVGDLSDYAMYANAHTYPNPGQLPDDTIQRINGLASLAASTRPVMTTEIGWSTSSFSQQTIAKYVLDAAMDGVMNGDAGMYFYGLYDDASGNWGLFNADGTPRPAATALHDLATLLADPGANAASFAPGSLSYTLSNTEAGDNSVLIEKSDGSFWLSLWNETEAAGSPHTITVTLAAPADTIVEYDPLTGTSSIASWSNVSSVQVSVPDHPVLLEIVSDGAASSPPVAPPQPSGPVIAVPTGEATNAGGTLAISGVSVADSFAASSPGTLTLNVSATVGRVAMTSGTKQLRGSGKHAMSVTGTLAQINADLATLSVTEPGGAANDVVTIDVWDQAGQEGTKSFDVAVDASASSPSPATEISNLYQQVLGRPADDGGLDFWLGILTGGTPLAIIQAELAQSPEAASDIVEFYQQLLDRVPSSSDLTFWEGQLNGIASLAQVRAAIAMSPEAAADVQALYQSTLGRSASSSEVSFWQNQMATGAASGLASVRNGLAQSQEGANLVATSYVAVFDVAPTAIQLTALQNQLGTQGSTQQTVQASILAQGEAAVPGLYQQILGRIGDPGGIAFWQGQIASGAETVPGVQQAFATSQESTGNIQSLYQQLLGRLSGSSEVSFWESQLAVPGGSLAGVRSEIAHSTESQSDLRTAYQNVYSAAPSQNVLGWLQNQLATGASTLAQVISALQNPLVIDTATGQAITDQSTDQPLGVAIASDPQNTGNETATIMLTNGSGTATDANGTLSGAGLTHSGAGVYTLTNSTAGGLSAALDALVFTPTQGQVSVGQSVTTDVSLSVQNKNSSTGTGTTTSITATAVSAPTHLDFIYGSIGSDSFNLPSGHGAAAIAENLTPMGNDVVSGFNLAQDMVQLSIAQFPNFSAVEAALTASSGNAVLSIGGSSSLTLLGVNPNNLTASNFQLV